MWPVQFEQGEARDDSLSVGLEPQRAIMSIGTLQEISNGLSSSFFPSCWLIDTRVDAHHATIGRDDGTMHIALELALGRKRNICGVLSCVVQDQCMFMAPKKLQLKGKYPLLEVR